MVQIRLNQLQYRYEVYHIIELFFDYSEVTFTEGEYDYYININDQSLECGDKVSKKVYDFENELTKKENIKKAIFVYFSKLTGKILPWGTLIGIRPTKKALMLLNKGFSEEEIINNFYNNNCTDRKKAKLCIDVSKKEVNIVNRDQDSVSIYVGMPFCPTRCLYCSFISSPISKCKNVVEPYIKALIKEIKALSDFIKTKKLKIDSVYFGGGTPTSVNDQEFSEVLKSIYQNFIKDYNVREFTVECGRPDSLSNSKFMSMKQYEVSRISINPQTMNDDTLKAIGRIHTCEDIINIYYKARELGFDNINMDIIIGLPGEDIIKFKHTCDEIYKLKPDNLTVHGLSIKRGSKLHEDIVNNKIHKLPEQNEVIEMYNLSEELASNLKLEPYYMYRQKNIAGNMENVGYSSIGKESIYNIQMIEEKQTILALGAHSVSKIVFLEEDRIERFANIKDAREYILRIDEQIEKKVNLLKTLYK